MPTGMAAFFVSGLEHSEADAVDGERPFRAAMTLPTKNGRPE